MTRRLLFIPLLLIGVTTDPAWSSTGSSEELTPLERLENAVSKYPDDPDLRWALARNLASQGEAAAAIEGTHHFVERWPERRPEARVEIARLLIEGGATAAAVGLLDEELGRNPRSAMARFYRGLAFRKEGLYREANREFVMAGSLEPSIRAETLLARSLSLFDLGQEEAAVDLLKNILDLDPTGDSAVRARLILRQREVLDLARRWRVDGYAGFEWDDNVTLEASENEVPASGSDDFRGLWGIGLTARPWVSERSSVTIGYRYDQTEHADLSDYNILANTLFASGTFRVDERLALRLDGLVSNTLQDLDNELTGGLIRPNLIYSFGPDCGALRVFSQFEGTEYHDDAIFEPWEQDAITLSVGAEHFLPLRANDSWIALSGSWARTLTQAEPPSNAGGFDGDYDYDSWRARGIATLALPFQIRAQVNAAYSHDRYHNDNFTYLLQTIGAGEPRKRRDDILSGRIGLSRAVIEHVRFEVYWRGARQISNVDAFDYDKQIIGALMRFSTD
jgi:tetratricopeptide (TPR) repeat protein